MWDFMGFDDWMGFDDDKDDLYPRRRFPQQDQESKEKGETEKNKKIEKKDLTT